MDGRVSEYGQVGVERVLFAWAAATALCMLQTAALFSLVGGSHGATPVAAVMTAGAVTLAALALALWGPRSALVSGTPSLAVLFAVVVGWPNKLVTLLVVGLSAAATCVAVLDFGAKRLPATMDRALARHGLTAWLCAAFAVLCLVQLGRAGLYVQDDASAVGAAVPMAAGHSCLPAYLRAAELAERGVDNLYLPLHYESGAETNVEGMADHLGDPFAYPPTALLMPVFALQLSRNFSLLSSLWFVVQVVALFAAALAAVAELAPGARARGAWLVPALIATFPVLAALQYGQAHVLTLCAAVGAMVAFRRGRVLLGGGLLGLAISLKLFPAVLLVYLLAAGRRRAVASTLAACAAYLVFTWMWLGSAPTTAFVSYALPRLASGEVFAKFFAEADFSTVHMGVPGVILVLDGLGIDSSDALRRTLGAVYGAVVLASAYCLGRRASSPVAWLAVLGLASTASLYAPATYHAAATLWLVTLLLAVTYERRKVAVALVAVGLVLQVAPFAPRLPLLWSLPHVAELASLLCIVLGLVVHLAPLLLRLEPHPVSPSPTTGTP